MSNRRSTGIALAALCPLLAAGCYAPPASPNADLPDASADGFLDVAPPAGVAFDETTNLSVKLISEVDDAALATVARANGVPEEYISLLPLATVVAHADLTLHYANGETTPFSEQAVIGPFEKAFEFACPQSVDVAVNVDVMSPVGNIDNLFSDAGIVLAEGVDYTCGESIVYRVYADEQGNVHFESVDDAAAPVASAHNAR
ncbi:MAG TPA: hypothetical protein P5572_08900 [Phycisphaerae bacterium]|nr:hypothetical protein [Phycisphaerae bacterium]